MPRPFTCSFGTGQPFTFPDRCVWCGRPSPGHTHGCLVKQSLSFSHFGGWHRVEVPCCKGCGIRMTAARLLRSVQFLAAVAAVAIPATWLLYHYTPLRGAALGWTVFGIIC